MQKKFPLFSGNLAGKIMVSKQKSFLEKRPGVKEKLIKAKVSGHHGNGGSTHRVSFSDAAAGGGSRSLTTCQSLREQRSTGLARRLADRARRSGRAPRAAAANSWILSIQGLRKVRKGTISPSHAVPKEPRHAWRRSCYVLYNNCRLILHRSRAKRPRPLFISKQG